MRPGLRQLAAVHAATHTASCAGKNTLLLASSCSLILAACCQLTQQLKPQACSHPVSCTSKLTDCWLLRPLSPACCAKKHLACGPSLLLSAADAWSMQAVLGQALAASSTFLKAFTAALVRQDAKRAPLQQALQLLAWSAAILETLDLGTASKAAAKLVQCQVSHLSSYSPLSVSGAGLYITGEAGRPCTACTAAATADLQVLAVFRRVHHCSNSASLYCSGRREAEGALQTLG